jgi:uncharacterized membrane protein YdjX (TVP38/TMEM64 family)
MTKRTLIIFTFISLVLTAFIFFFLNNISHENISAWLVQWGKWAPIIYTLMYILGTIFLLPSTPLNISGGALFGLYQGTLWSSLGAIIAALITFAFTRTIGRQWVVKKLGERWKAVEADIYHQGLLYLFIIRLLPILPYGIVNLAAGLTAVTWFDYTVATILGTVIGLVPFIAIGSYGVDAVQGGSAWGLILAIFLVISLILGAIWYKKKRTPPPS